MQIKTDCFAFKSDNLYNGCNALDKLYCKREECKFYKNKKTFQKKYNRRDIYENK